MAERKPRASELADRIAELEPLDSVAKPLAKKVRDVLPGGPVKDALSGTWLGHAVHPLMTDVVIGSFTSATLLDHVGGDECGRARESLIAIGIAAYGPTALTGVNDWADSEPADDGVRRVGLVHAATNSVALSLQIASLAARRRGDSGRGALLGAAGTAVLAAGGYLGGHLSFAKGVGPDQTVFDAGPGDWTPAGAADDLRDGEPVRMVAGDTPVMVVRRGDRLQAIHDRCSHRGCALSDGELDGDVVECACHGSRFALADGALLRGPATAPQPAFEARERDGRIELRRSPAAP